jgi:hypothetical protein
MLGDIIYDAEQAIADYIDKNGTEVNGRTLGLDPRALHRGWVVDDMIVVRSDADRSLQYYGGFEYVDSAARKTIGDFVFYDRNEDERVDGALECFEQEEA